MGGRERIDEERRGDDMTTMSSSSTISLPCFLFFYFSDLESVQTDFDDPSIELCAV